MNEKIEAGLHWEYAAGLGPRSARIQNQALNYSHLAFEIPTACKNSLLKSQIQIGFHAKTTP